MPKASASSSGWVQTQQGVGDASGASSRSTAVPSRGSPTRWGWFGSAHPYWGLGEASVLGAHRTRLQPGPRSIARPPARRRGPRLPPAPHARAGGTVWVSWPKPTWFRRCRHSQSESEAARPAQDPASSPGARHRPAAASPFRGCSSPRCRRGRCCHLARQGPRPWPCVLWGTAKLQGRW